MSVRIVPCTISAARRFVEEHHRHNKAPQGGLFAVAVADDEGKIRGVGIAGRPVSRMIDYRETCEITRNCTDGYPNACSMIYSALCRAAKALGYRAVITYTLETESGSSLRGAGFRAAARTKAKNWNAPARPRKETCVDLFGEKRKYPHMIDKVRWERVFETSAPPISDLRPASGTHRLPQRDARCIPAV